MLIERQYVEIICTFDSMLHSSNLIGSILDRGILKDTLLLSLIPHIIPPHLVLFSHSPLDPQIDENHSL